MRNRKFIALAVLAAAVSLASAQTTTTTSTVTLPAAPVWVKVATEGSSTASAANSITLPAGTIYQFGTVGHFCDPVTVAQTTTISPVYVTSFKCTVGGVATPDPANGVVKEVDVEQTASAQTVTVAGSPVVVTAAPAAKPITCSSSSAHTVTFTYSTTYSTPTGAITAASATATCTK